MKKIYKEIKNKIITFLKNVYNIRKQNILFIAFNTFLIFIIFKIFRKLVPNLLNIHLNLTLEIDYLVIYSMLLSLMLPLFIMLLEKMSKRHDYIVVETYLKKTLMFPILIYFCSNIIIFAFFKDQYYFIFTILISIILLILMYYQSLKLLSDLRYEKEKIGETRYKLVSSDLNDQIKHFTNNNKISNYEKYGIIVDKMNFIYTHDYKKKLIYPAHDLRLIEQYNYKLLDKIVKELKDVNIKYVNDFNKNNIRPKIIISLLDIGSTTQINNSCITIYYDAKYEDEADNIINLLSDKIYITNETNNHFYIKSNYEYLQRDCINAIKDSSATLLANNLDKYFDMYIDYISGIKNEIGDYSYKEVYEHTHSLYEPRAYELLKLIKKDIVDYSRVILKQDNQYLMNELIRFLYRMMLQSYTKNELLSIQYLYNLYEYLTSQVLELNYDNSYEQIKLELFEFIDVVKYSLNLENGTFNKDVLIICNHTLSKILYNMKDRENNFNAFLKKIFGFINKIYKELEQVSYSQNTANVKMAKLYKEILDNYNCNFFATLAYIVNSNENSHKNITFILDMYENYNEKDLSNLLLDTIEKDYNDNTYSWDLLEDHDFNEAYFSNTVSYLIHFYCLLLNTRSKVKLPNSYELSIHADNIIKEFEKLNNQGLIDKFNKLVDNIKEEEKEYIRKTPISLEKIDLFKKNFLEKYNKNAELTKIFKLTNNINLVKDKKKGINYLGINNIVDKTYFLEKMPHDKNIVWSNFEETFVDAFINSEEEKYASLLEKNSDLVETEILSYIIENKLDFSKYIIFADYYSIHTILQYSNIAYEIPDKMDYKGLVSSHYFVYQNKYIPIYSIADLEDNCIYLIKIDELGKLEKSIDDFQIEIKDFLNNKELIDKFMSSKVEGLNLRGIERKNHLLEKVNIFIQEYIVFNDEKMKCLKFIK